MKILLVFSFLLTAIPPGNAQSNAVVVELFTSQGCSSCPAADKNLTEIIQRAVKDGNPIYGLSFHVDYWNYIGWKDPYSNKEFTERQRKYAHQLNLQTLYTPQMIVNGHDEFVGANKSDAEESIKEALKDLPAYQIKVNSIRTTGGMVTLQYALDKDAHGEILNIAIVERNLENMVTHGENHGRKLHHDNVVRSFKTIPLERDGDIQIPIANVNLENTSVILYVQDLSWHVLAVTSAALNTNQQ